MGCSLYEFENLCEAAYYQQIERAKRAIDMDLTPRSVYMPPIVAYFDFPRSQATSIINKWASKYASEVSSYAREHKMSSVSSVYSSEDISAPRPRQGILARMEEEAKEAEQWRQMKLEDTKKLRQAKEDGKEIKAIVWIEFTIDTGYTAIRDFVEEYTNWPYEKAGYYVRTHINSSNHLNFGDHWKISELDWLKVMVRMALSKVEIAKTVEIKAYEYYDGAWGSKLCDEIIWPITPEEKEAKEEAEKLFIQTAEEQGYVDLGLSVVWRWMNLGANTVEEYGLYYQWGDIVGYESDVNDGKYFSWDDGRHEVFLRSSYKWCKGRKDVLTKYNTDAYAGPFHKSDYMTILEEDDDAASVELGSKWRMPTYAEWNELIKKCTWVWTTIDGIKGYRVQSNIQGYTDNWIFLPAAGIRQDDKLNGLGNVGCYWSSSLPESLVYRAHSVYFKPGHYEMDKDCRCYGLSIRPVREVSKKDREEARKKQEERKGRGLEKNPTDSQVDS